MCRLSGARRLNNEFVLFTCHTACFPRCAPRCWRTTWSSSSTRTGQWPVSWWLPPSFHSTRTPLSKQVWWNRTTSWTVKSVWNDNKYNIIIRLPCGCDCMVGCNIILLPRWRVADEMCLHQKSELVDSKIHFTP